MEKVYYDVKTPGSFAGKRTLHRETEKKYNKKIKSNDVDEFLRKQETHTLHVIPRRRFPRRKIIVSSPKHTLGIDLADFQQLAKHNDNYRYVLVGIDLFSRFVFTAPLKKKEGKLVAKILNEILQQEPYKKIQSDRGKEFLNSHVEKVLKTHHCQIYHVESELKVAMAERVIQTLKRKLYKKMHADNNFIWLRHLEGVTRSYNNTLHTTFLKKYTPKQVHRGVVDKDIIFSIIHKKKKKKIEKNLLKVADAVRISRNKFKFARGYFPQNSEEIFYIHKIRQTDPITYIIKDYNGEVIKGGFY